MGSATGRGRVHPFRNRVYKGSEDWVCISACLCWLVVTNIKARFSGGVRPKTQNWRVACSGKGLQRIPARTRGGVKTSHKSSYKPVVARVLALFGGVSHPVTIRKER